MYGLCCSVGLNYIHTYIPQLKGHHHIVTMVTIVMVMVLLQLRYAVMPCYQHRPSPVTTVHDLVRDIVH